MPKITGGFTTKNKSQMFAKLKAAGVKYKMPFESTSELRHTKTLPDIDLVNFKNQTLKKLKKTKDKLFEGMTLTKKSVLTP